MPSLVDAHHLGLGQTGNETWARNVVRELAARDAGVHVAVTPQGRRWVQHWPSDRVHVVSASSTRRLTLDLPRIKARVRPSALLVQYTLPPLGREVPGVVVVHDLSFERAEAREWIPPASLLRYRATIRRSARRAARVLVPSEWTRADVIRTYGLSPDRVVVAGNALDPELVAALESARPQPRTGLTVLAVGTILPRKNLGVVAEAVSRLRGEGLDVRLRLVGPRPPAGADVERGLRARLGDALEVVGAVSVPVLAREYLSADVLAFPSLFEGFGIPVVEAMAAGLPVVASDSTCLPEVGADAARYANPHDVGAWVEQLGAVLLDDAERERLTSLGRRRCTAFRWQDTGDAVERALREAAA